MAFRVESRLGRGRLVDTFDALLEVAGEKLEVVIKRARPEFRDNPALQDALLEWGQAQSGVDHRDVVDVLEAGRDDSGVYIIQERVEGATLARTLATLRKSRRTLHPAAALLITERVAGALTGLQGSMAGYHGDLDPGEVLLGYDGAVKVGDQRLSDLLSLVGLDLEPRGADRAVAGPGVAGDIYTFALVTLEMMLGHPVWRTPSMSVADALRALVDFAPVAQLNQTLARDLGRLLQPCLAQAPSDRPHDFAALADGIADLRARHGVKHEPQSLGSFVELVSPPLEDADAPTRMAAAVGAEVVPIASDRRAEFEAASVVITPEILAQAEAEYHARRNPGGSAPELDAPEATDRVRLRSEAPAARPPPPPRAASHTLEGRSVPVDLLTPPSALRASARSIPNVSAKAAAYAADRLRPDDWTRWWPYGLAVVAALTVAWLVSGPSVRTLQLQLTSEPTAASVFIDDVFVGETPLTRPLDVSADRIQLRFEKEGFEPYRVTIGTEEAELRYEAPLQASP